MSETMDCTSCGGVDTLEYSPELGTLACTRCGTVSTSSASHAFEYLARVDEEDRYQNGRHYISAGTLSGDYGSLGGMQIGRGGKGNNWARATGESRQIYQSQKKVCTLADLNVLAREKGMTDGGFAPARRPSRIGSFAAS